MKEKSNLKVGKILLITLIILILLQSLNGKIGSAAAETSLENNNPSSSDFSNVTSPLTVMKWAQGVNESQEITLYYNSTANITTWDTAEMILPENWTGYQLAVYVYELTENRTWVNNTGFENTADPWVNGTYDGPGHANTFYAEWLDDGHGTGDDCILLGEDGVGGAYDPKDAVWFEQNFSIRGGNVGEIVWAGLTLQFNISSASGVWNTTLGFGLTVYINNVRVWRVGLASYDLNIWHSSGLVAIDKSLINATNTNIRVALEFLPPHSIWYSPDIKPRVKVDNVKVFVASRVKPSDVNLKMNHLDVADLGYGNGTVTEMDTWVTSPVEANFTWFPTPGIGIDDDIYVTFKTNLALYIKKVDKTLYDMNLAAKGKNLAVFNGTFTQWDFYVYVHVPSYYGKYKFNLSIPYDWNITFVAEPTTPTKNRIMNCTGGKPGDRYIEVPVYLISDTPDGYWIIKAKSPNYVYEVWTQVYNAATNKWENSTMFRPFNTTRVVARILNTSGLPPSDVTLYAANITIYFSNGTVWFTSLVTPDANGYVISQNITIGGTNTTGDLYTVEVRWNSEVEAGDLQRHFSVIHRTSLSIWNPPEARSSLKAKAYYGDLVLLTVRFHDEDHPGKLLRGATVKCNWTSGEKVFTDLKTGEYEIVLNTSELGGNGRFFITVTAQKQYYDAASVTFILDVYYRTVLSSPQAPEYGIPVLIGENLTVDLYYERVDAKIGIANATVTAGGTWSTRLLNVTYKEGGHYLVSFNTSGLSAGYYTITLNAYKPFYETRNISIKFYFVYKTKYLVGGLKSYVYVGYPENFTVWFKYELYNGSPVTDANVQVYVEWLGEWLNMEDLNHDGNYTITLNVTSVMDIGNYTLYIIARKPMYQKIEVVTSIQVLPVPTCYFIYVSEGNITGTLIRVEEGAVFNITVTYFDTLHQTGIEGAIVYLVLPNGTELVFHEIGGGNYTLKIDTRDFKPGETYQLTLVISKYRYKAIRETIYLAVEYKVPPVSKVMLTGILTGSGVVAGIFALAASWYFYFRFPAFVRLTRSISKRLMRGKSPKFGKVREREEIVRDLIRRDYGTIVPPSFLEKPEVEVEVPEVEEVSEELVEAGEETLKEVTETIETLTGIEAPRELKRLIEEEKEEIEETEEKVEREEREESEEGKED